MDAKFTPGPWYVGSQNDMLYVINKPPRPSNDHPNHEADVTTIAQVSINRSLHAYDANASLIAAAPELYEALAALLKPYDGVFGKTGHLSGCDAEAISKAFAALAKAEGR